MEVNGELVYEDTKKANALNEFFRSCSHIDGHDDELDYSTDVPHAIIEDIQVERNEVPVFKILVGLKQGKATGPNNIPNRVLKNCAADITARLTRIIQHSLNTGRMAKCWKIANLTPLDKKGEKHQPGNYRPVCLQPCVSKVLERVVHNHVMDFLEDNRFLSYSQPSEKVHQPLLICRSFITNWQEAWIRGRRLKLSLQT